MSKRGPMGVAPTFDTPLQGGLLAQFEQWRSALPPTLQSSQDYDLQGAYLDAAKADGRLHMTDKFKKPNHMTFSDGSQYSSPAMQGGRWVGTGQANPFNPAEQQFLFWASPHNMAQHPMSVMEEYFKANEKGNPVVYPINYRLPQR